MRDIDLIKTTMKATFAKSKAFVSIDEKIEAFANAAKYECETMKSDPCIFKIWPSYVAAAEQLQSFVPSIPEGTDELSHYRCIEGLSVLCKGKQLLRHIAGARVPMPDNTRDYLELCNSYRPPF